MAGIDGQLAAVGLIVAAATGYIGRATWRTWFAAKAGGCGSGCGKCATPAPDDVKPGRIALTVRGPAGSSPVPRPLT